MATDNKAQKLPYKIVEDGVQVTMHLTPGAAQTKLDRIDQNADGKARLRASVSVVPEKGKANKALIALLAKKLRLPKTSIQIIAGQQSRDKTVLISGSHDTLSVAIEELLKPLA